MLNISIGVWGDTLEGRVKTLKPFDVHDENEDDIDAESSFAISDFEDFFFGAFFEETTFC